MNFISAIHTTAFTVLREHNEQNADDKQKMLFEQMCEVINNNRAWEASPSYTRNIFNL